jgi:hypothetical protein
MTDESDVRSWLATAEVPDLRPLDFEQTVSTGRGRVRQRRVRRIAGTAAFGLAAVLAVPAVITLIGRDSTEPTPPATARRTPPPDGPFTCTFRALPTPSGLDAFNQPEWRFDIAGMDRSGRYVIAQAMGPGGPGGTRVPVLWDNGVGRVLSPEMKSARPTAVGENGTVAGEYMSGGGSWVYRAGVVTDIPVPAGTTTVTVSDINANGDLLGTAFTQGTARVAIWRAGKLAEPQFLEAPGEVVTPMRFLPDGGVVGWQSIENGVYVWNAQGEGTAYAVPAGAIQTRPVGVGNGWVFALGKQSVEGGQIPVRWKIGTGAAEWFQLPAVDPPAENVDLTAVGENGALLFSAIQTTGSGMYDHVTRTFVARGGHVAQLPAPGGGQAFPKGMDEYGTKVVGRVSVPDGSMEPTMAIWTC